MARLFDRSPMPDSPISLSVCRMAVDVEVQAEIGCRRENVAGYVADPDNATAWYQNIKAVVWETEKPVGVGSRIRFTAQFLGRRLDYLYEVTDFVAGERLVMRTAEGPFPMETIYTWSDIGSGSTRMTLRNRGEPAGFSKWAAPVMAMAMRRANTQDLARLKRILEARSG